MVDPPAGRKGSSGPAWAGRRRQHPGALPASEAPRSQDHTWGPELGRGRKPCGPGVQIKGSRIPPWTGPEGHSVLLGPCQAFPRASGPSRPW